jgi:hypothetical protein
MSKPAGRQDYREVLGKLFQSLKSIAFSDAIAKKPDVKPAASADRARVPAEARRPTRPPFEQPPLSPFPARSLERLREERRQALKPTNLPTNRGRATANDEDKTRRAELPAGPLEPLQVRGAEALAFVLKNVDLSALEHGDEVASGGPEATDLLMRRIRAGAERLRKRPKPDEAGFIVGFDFGTSCSKIVIHQPGAGDLAYALPVPKHLQVREQGKEQDHLWRSMVWFDDGTGRFTLEPADGSRPLQGFKTGLIQSKGHRMTKGVTNAQAATAYLALMIAYVIGHHDLSAPAGFNRTRHFSRFHFGVPVACKDEGGCVREFSRVLSAAFKLVPFAPEVDMARVREALQTATAEMAATSTTPFVLFEELAGVIAGYRASPDSRRGPHVVVDVGAATLDVATFFIPDGDYKIPVYMSAVELLGAEALTSARINEVPDATFRAACNQHTRRVLSFTFLRKDADFFPQNGIPKPLLFVGGGRLTDVHDATYQTYPKGLEAPRVTPLPGRNLRYDKNTDFARLLVAWGLSQEEIDLPLFKPPSQIEDEVRRVRDFSSKYVDKDLC